MMDDEDLFEPIDQMAAMAISAEVNPIFCQLSAAFREGNLFIELPESSLPPSPYYVYESGRLYLKRAKIMVEAIQQHYIKLDQAKPRLVLDLEKINEKLDLLLTQNLLLPEQAQGILEAAKSTISCIWGGPGTGKTYTAGWLVQLFLEQHPRAKVALAAPTGKATANIKVSIQKRVDPPLQGRIEAKTLHSLLGLHRFGTSKERGELGFDLIVVDESSMIDAALACSLLARVAQGTRLIFLGDPDQLPPVEPGEPFCAIVQAKMAHNSAGHLITTKRQEEGAILELAALVREGRADAALELLTNDSSGAISWSFQEEDVPHQIANVKSLYIKTAPTIDAQFQALNRVRLLCPLRDGKDGFLAINEEIVRSKRHNFHPIMITKNDFRLGLSNGQIGILQAKQAYFEDPESPTGYRQIPEVLLPTYEPAYCLSVHKSQGSEFEEVQLFLPSKSERFGRKMLYTAITRAKKHLHLIATPNTLRATIENEGRKLTTFFTLPRTQCID